MLCVEMGQQYWEELELKVWMAPDQDLVTGDLKESSSMMVLFLRSSGAAFAFWSGLRLWLTGWLDLTPLAGALVHRKSYRRVAK